uniref:Protein MIS12 homolog n=2 Tax=Takifugu rubripes TaxID=31033 RepID=A0A3B5KLS1_TAKRU
MVTLMQHFSPKTATSRVPSGFNIKRETGGNAEMEANTDVDFSPSTLKLYETQFFGFTPNTCMLRVYSAFQDCLCDILPVVEKVCVRQLGRDGSGVAGQLLQVRARDCSRRLQQFLEDRFKQLSERMEALLVSRCLSVPPNVVLPEDKCHDKYPEDIKEIQRLESSIAATRHAYEAEVYGRQALLAELEEQKMVQKRLEEILAWVRDLQVAWLKAGNGGFNESFREVMKSVQKLQEAAGEICKNAPH